MLRTYQWCSFLFTTDSPLTLFFLYILTVCITQTVSSQVTGLRLFFPSSFLSHVHVKFCFYSNWWGQSVSSFNRKTFNQHCSRAGLHLKALNTQYQKWKNIWTHIRRRQLTTFFGIYCLTKFRQPPLKEYLQQSLNCCINCYATSAINFS